MPSHARPKPRRVPRGLLRAGLVVSAAGAALTGGAAAANAAAPASGTGTQTSAKDTGAVAHALTHAVTDSAGGALAPVKDLKLDPLANTSVDPLANAVGTQIADFKPVSTALLTDPVAKGGALRTLPLVGSATRILPG
ncbi:hypothetical protein MUU72_08085 [Streptomyces sp. RS10V-4]|uniref:hypothetical protein n=1 Tax=Streptomyces rhizoryzae TaxID=2932493 RepID=UPI0020040B47|nr:hypothetical protein [Streptomyces rhizoryzae]MCK7623057.1 hypothetical protein [Streptomyces rhizoryzae]